MYQLLSDKPFGVGWSEPGLTPTRRVDAYGLYGAKYSLRFHHLAPAERRAATLAILALRRLGWKVHIRQAKESA